MRRYTLLLGTVLAIGGAVGAWVQAQEGAAPAGSLFAAPQEFVESDAQPLSAADTGGSGAVTIDHQVRPVANGTPQVAARRSGGLAGRLQAIRRSEASEADTSETSESAAPTAAAPSGFTPMAATRPADQPVTSSISDDDDDTAANNIPSVLKRSGSSAAAPATNRTPATPVSTLPTASAVRPSQRGSAQGTTIPRTAPTTPAAVPATLAPAPAGASPAPATMPVAETKRPGSRSQVLATGSNAALTVETTGPKAMVLGKPATYTIAIGNLGVSEAREVFVAVDLPPHVELGEVQGTVGDARPATEGTKQRLVWQIDRINGRGQEKLTLELTPQSGEPIDLAVEWTMAPPMISSKIEVQEPKLAMTLKGPQEVQFGETATYQIVVANPGTGDAEDVVVNLVSVDATEADAKKLGTIAAGQQKVIEVSMTASQAGEMKMHFAAKSGSLVTEAEQDVIVRRANLQATLQGPQLVFAGADATYQVQIVNDGDAPAQEVLIGVLLPEGAEYLGGINGATAKGGQLVWNAGNLAAGGTAKFEFTCQMNTAGACDVQMQVKSADLVADAMTTTKVESVADLKLVVADPLGPKPVGEEVTYQVTIVNRGTKAARKVAVVVNFSEGMEPTSVEGGKAEVGSGQALFQPIASIEPGAEVVLKVKAKAERAGSHIFRAEVRCTDPDTRLASEQTNRFFGSGTSNIAETELGSPTIGAKPTKTKLR